MKIYLDTSVYNRPFDDQNQSRIRLETTAFRSICSLIDLGVLDLVISSTLTYEISLNPFPTRQQWIRQQLNKAKYYQNLTQSVIIRANMLEQQGLKKWMRFMSLLLKSVTVNISSLVMIV